MEHLGADADLCAKAKLKAVRKSGRCVDIDAGSVHLIQKCPGMRFVVRDDCFGMSGVVAVDMPDCFFQAADRLYRQLERQIFCSVVGFCCRHAAVDLYKRAVIRMDFDVLSRSA